MPPATVLVEKSARVLTLTLHRPESRNTLNRQMMEELNLGLARAEADPDCALVVLQGGPGVFCTGMDFKELFDSGVLGDPHGVRQWAGAYMGLLKRLAQLPRVVVAKLDGQVLAGGVGLVAACDLVVATERTQFSLSEALFGLLPANVLPYLIRRVGFQAAYAMTLTTRALMASEGRAAQLVDELTEQPDDAIRKLTVRCGRLDPHTLANMKGYFRRMWIITEEMERAAVDELVGLLATPRVQRNIANYVQHQKFPWEK